MNEIMDRRRAARKRVYLELVKVSLGSFCDGLCVEWLALLSPSDS
jgi:hypothetical protein